MIQQTLQVLLILLCLCGLLCLCVYVYPMVEKHKRKRAKQRETEDLKRAKRVYTLFCSGQYSTVFMRCPDCEQLNRISGCVEHTKAIIKKRTVLLCAFCNCAIGITPNPQYVVSTKVYELNTKEETHDNTRT